jgi:hypothetical protein
MKVTTVVAGVSVSAAQISVAVMKRAPFSI